jgi:hypothetical protein
MSFEFLVLSFEFSPTHPFISDFGFRISDLPPARPGFRSEEDWALKTQNSKLKTDEVVS